MLRKGKKFQGQAEDQPLKTCKVHSQSTGLQAERDTLCIDGLNQGLSFHPGWHKCFSSHGIVAVSQRALKQ